MPAGALGAPDGRVLVVAGQGSANHVEPTRLDLVEIKERTSRIGPAAEDRENVWVERPAIAARRADEIIE